MVESGKVKFLDSKARNCKMGRDSTVFMQMGGWGWRWLAVGVTDADVCACLGFEQTDFEYCRRLVYLKMRICKSAGTNYLQTFLPCCSNVKHCCAPESGMVFPLALSTRCPSAVSLQACGGEGRKGWPQASSACSCSAAQKVSSSCQTSKPAYQLAGVINTCR